MTDTKPTEDKVPLPHSFYGIAMPGTWVMVSRRGFSYRSYIRRDLASYTKHSRALDSLRYAMSEMKLNPHIKLTLN